MSAEAGTLRAPKHIWGSANKSKRRCSLLRADREEHKEGFKLSSTEQDCDEREDRRSKESEPSLGRSSEVRVGRGEMKVERA